MKIVRNFGELAKIEIQGVVEGEVVGIYYRYICNESTPYLPYLAIYEFSEEYGWSGFGLGRKTEILFQDINYNPVFWFQEEEDATAPL